MFRSARRMLNVEVVKSLCKYLFGKTHEMHLRGVELATSVSRVQAVLVHGLEEVGGEEL